MKRTKNATDAILAGVPIKKALVSENRKMNESSSTEKGLQDNLLRSIESLRKAWSDVLYKYEALEDYDSINADIFSEKYPFQKSFDELLFDIQVWKEALADEFSKNNTVLDLKRMESDLRQAIHDYMADEGFDDAEVKQYTNLKIKDEKDRVVINVGAELSYDGCIDLSNKLDKVISKYDKDAYFDMEAPGLMIAVIEK